MQSNTNAREQQGCLDLACWLYKQIAGISSLTRGLSQRKILGKLLHYPEGIYVATEHSCVVFFAFFLIINLSMTSPVQRVV